MGNEVGWILGAFVLGSGSTLLGAVVGLLIAHVAKTGNWPIREKVVVPRKVPRAPEPSMVQLPAPPGAPPPSNGEVTRKNEALGSFERDFGTASAFSDLVERMESQGSIIPDVSSWVGDGR